VKNRTVSSAGLSHMTKNTAIPTGAERSEAKWRDLFCCIGDERRSFDYAAGWAASLGMTENHYMRWPWSRAKHYRLSLSRVVPTRVSAIDARRARLTRSFRNTTPMMTAKTMPVSRRAETMASGARLSAQMTTQVDP
jgi:hypothetical protein